MQERVRLCVFKSLREYWALPRLSGTVSASSVKDTIRQGVKGRGGRGMDGWEWRIVLEGKERDQTEEIRKQCHGGFRYLNKKHRNALDSEIPLLNKEMG